MKILNWIEQFLCIKYNKNTNKKKILKKIKKCSAGIKPWTAQLKVKELSEKFSYWISEEEWKQQFFNKQICKITWK